MLKSGRPRAEDPRQFESMVRTNYAEYRLLMSTKPEKIRLAEWIRRLALQAAYTAQRHPEVMKILIERPIKLEHRVKVDPLEQASLRAEIAEVKKQLRWWEKIR